MKSIPLSKTNPHLFDSLKRREAVFASVVSSSAVEGIRLIPQEIQSFKQPQPSAAEVTPR